MPRHKTTNATRRACIPRSQGKKWHASCKTSESTTLHRPELEKDWDDGKWLVAFVSFPFVSRGVEWNRTSPSFSCPAVERARRWPTFRRVSSSGARGTSRMQVTWAIFIILIKRLTFTFLEIANNEAVSRIFQQFITCKRSSKRRSTRAHANKMERSHM